MIAQKIAKSIGQAMIKWNNIDDANKWMIFLTAITIIISVISLIQSCNSTNTANSAQSKVTEMEKNAEKRDCVLSVDSKLKEVQQELLEFAKLVTKCSLNGKKSCSALRKNLWSVRESLKSTGALKDEESVRNILNKGIQLTNEVDSILKKEITPQARGQLLKAKRDSARQLFQKFDKSALIKKLCEQP